MHELEAGREYSPIITTGGGFYRYHLKDNVRCCGHFNATPLLEFVGKHDAVSDICGEKLNATLVARYLDELRTAVPAPLLFSMLSPVPGVPAYYVLYIETEAADESIAQLVSDLENRLRQSHHYNYARDLGQLDSLRWQRVRNGWLRYQHVLTQAGARLGDIKPTYLDAKQPWHKHFGETS